MVQGVTKLIKTLMLVANEKEMNRIVTGRESYANHPHYGDKPLFVSWDSIVEGVMNSITFSAAPRPTVQDRLNEMRRSEITYVIYVVEQTSRHFIPVSLLSTVELFLQVFDDGKITVLQKTTLN